MKGIALFMTLFLSGSCGNAQNSQTQKFNQKPNQMDTNQLTNPTVKSAIDALQANDKNAWYSHFTSDAVFTDDGNAKNLKSFFDNAFNHKEKFLSIETVANDGKDLVGDFFAGQWGTFKVYFKFDVNESGKISKLAIGQAN